MKRVFNEVLPKRLSKFGGLADKYHSVSVTWWRHHGVDDVTHENGRGAINYLLGQQELYARKHIIFISPRVHDQIVFPDKEEPRRGSSRIA